MISSVSPSRFADNYALRTLTEIAAGMKSNAGHSSMPGVGVSAAQRDPLQEAAAKISQILLDTQSRLPALQTPTVTVDPRPPEVRDMEEGPRAIGGEAVILRSSTQGASVMLMGPWGSVTMATGQTEEGPAMLIGNDKPTTITLVSDIDIGLVAGSAGDEFIAVAGRGNIAHVYGGDGSDIIAVAGAPQSALATPKIERVDGGSGNDHIIVAGASADRISGGTGDDSLYVHIVGYGPASGIDGGEGDDEIFMRSVGIVSGVAGGDGNDVITVDAGTVRNVSGGDGDDTINIGGRTIEQISGGRGDDEFYIWNPYGNVATLHLNEGDGHDVVEAHGPVKIERFNADGTAQKLDLASVSVTRGEEGAFIIDFGNGTDSLTIIRNGSVGEKIALQATSDGALLI
jgi:hypothetical protein